MYPTKGLKVEAKRWKKMEKRKTEERPTTDSNKVTFPGFSVAHNDEVTTK
jgi:hypothetical protein